VVVAGFGVMNGIHAGACACFSTRSGAVSSSSICFAVKTSGSFFEIVADQKRLATFNAEILKDTGFVTKTAIGTFEVGYIH